MTSSGTSEPVTCVHPGRTSASAKRECNVATYAPRRPAKRVGEHITTVAADRAGFAGADQTILLRCTVDSAKVDLRLRARQRCNTMAHNMHSWTVESSKEYLNGLQITADSDGAIRLCDYVLVKTTQTLRRKSSN